MATEARHHDVENDTVEPSVLGFDRCAEAPTVDVSAIDLVEYRHVDPAIPSLDGIDAVVRLSSSASRSVNIFAEVRTSDLWWCTDDCVAAARACESSKAAWP